MGGRQGPGGRRHRRLGFAGYVRARGRARAKKGLLLESNFVLSPILSFG